MIPPPADDSDADHEVAALAELEARSDAVQHEIDDAEHLVHPPHRPTFADQNTDDAAFALDGAMPTEDEIRREERLHEDQPDPIAETRERATQESAALVRGALAAATAWLTERSSPLASSDSGHGSAGEARSGERRM